MIYESHIVPERLPGLIDIQGRIGKVLSRIKGVDVVMVTAANESVPSLVSFWTPEFITTPLRGLI